MARYKLRRKQIRQPDEFITVSRRILGYFQTHRRDAILAAGLALALILLPAGWWTYGEWARRDAATALYQGVRSHRAGNCGEALVPLRHAASWKRTPSGLLARLYLGDCLWRTARYADASQVFGELADLAQAPDVRQLALVRRGSARLALGQAEAALDDFKAALALSGPYEAEGLWGLARAHETLGHRSEAAETYRRLAEADSASPLRDLAKSKAEELKGPETGASAG